MTTESFASISAKLLMGSVSNTIDLHIRFVENAIRKAFEYYEPKSFPTGVDLYVEVGEGRSLTVYIQSPMPYPYEPSKEVREMIDQMGFRNWGFVFVNDVMDVEWDKDRLSRIPLLDKVNFASAHGIFYNSPDIVLGWGPRHSKFAVLTTHPVHGRVDSRFNQEHYEANYNFKGRKA